MKKTLQDWASQYDAACQDIQYSRDEITDLQAQIATRNRLLEGEHQKIQVALSKQSEAQEGMRRLLK